LAEYGLEGVGIVRRDDRTDPASEVNDEARLLRRALRVQVRPIAWVPRAPDAPLAGEDALDLDALETLDLSVRDALGTEWEVVGVDLQPVDAAHDPAVVVAAGHIRVLICRGLIIDHPAIEGA